MRWRARRTAQIVRRHSRLLLNPGFSERTYEFCFNAEYCHLNAAILASHPHIPTQNAEKDLGYDVEFEIRRGGFVKSLFLQHKVSSFASVRAGRNGKFYSHHGGPYYRFPVDNAQHQTLLDLSVTKGDAFYCAPCFIGSKPLEAHWRAQTIGANSLLLDPVQVGPAGLGRHNITYGPAGEIPALHSDTRTFERAYRADKERMPPLKRQEINPRYVEELSEELLQKTPNRGAARPILRETHGKRPIEVAQQLLGRLYQVSWILIRDA